MPHKTARKNRPHRAAERECLEETGCTLRRLEELCCHDPNNGMSDMRIYVFAARVESETAALDENGVNAKRWVSGAELLQMLKNDRLHCGVSILALLYALTFAL